MRSFKYIKTHTRDLIQMIKEKVRISYLMLSWKLGIDPIIKKIALI